MTKEEHTEIVVCGRLPKKRDGRVDVYKVERIMRDVDDAKTRVDVLKRLVEYRPHGRI